MTPARGTTAVEGGADAVWQVESEAVGRIEVRNDYCRTGEHRPDGWVVVAGPGIDAGSVDRTVSILELAPTFGGLLGVPTPGMPRAPAADLIDGARRPES